MEIDKMIGSTINQSHLSNMQRILSPKGIGKIFKPNGIKSTIITFRAINYSRDYNNRGNDNFDDKKNTFNVRKSFGNDSRSDRFSKPRSDRPPRESVESYTPLESTIEALFDKQGSVESVEMYSDLEVKMEGNNIPAPINDLSTDRIPFGVKQNLSRAKITQLTPVQKNAFSIGLDRRDLMACSQTGSGKTLAFLVPLLSTLISKDMKAEKIRINEFQSSLLPRVLIIAPTRELVNQIYDEARKFASGTKLTGIAAVYGGASQSGQIEQIKKGCEVLIGTPGRLQDFLSRGIFRLDKIEYLVLDEADRMLDMGFEPAIRDICGAYKLNKERTTMMFSATFAKEIQHLARDFLKKDYIFMSVGRVGSTTTLITQNFIPCSDLDLNDTIVDVMKQHIGKKVLVFVEAKFECETLRTLLEGSGIIAETIHGDRGQRDRDWAIKSFKTGKTKVLIATDVASRGLDIGDIDIVVNYRMPASIDQYVHRIGRTGRAGKKGASISIITPKDWVIKKDLIKFLEEHSLEVPQYLHNLQSDKTPSKRGGGGRTSNGGSNRYDTRTGYSSPAPTSRYEPRERYQPRQNDRFQSSNNGGYSSRESSGKTYSNSDSRQERPTRKLSLDDDDFDDDDFEEFTKTINKRRY
jgi:ATP-dependent RNA helicase DDX3X